jgi:hypothetical protein
VNFFRETRSSPQILPSRSGNKNRAPSRWDETRSDLVFQVVGDTGIEPVTSSVSVRISSHGRLRGVLLHVYQCRSVAVCCRLLSSVANARADFLLTR